MIIKKCHSWNVTPKEAVNIQKRLLRYVRIRPLKRKISLIASADVSFTDRYAFGAVCVMTFPELKPVEYITRRTKVLFPYVPTLLSFREGPVLCRCFKALRNNPDLIIFDGQGIAHPRKMGLATHFGVILDVPTIGSAKSHLCGEWNMPGNEKGDFSYVVDKTGSRIGVVLRTRESVKPIFVSPGHLIDIQGSVSNIIECTKRYRIPDPIRMSHRTCTEYKRGSEIKI